MANTGAASWSCRSKTIFVYCSWIPKTNAVIWRYGWKNVLSCNWIFNTGIGLWGRRCVPMIFFVLSSLTACFISWFKISWTKLLFGHWVYWPSLGIENIMIGDYCKKKGTGMDNLDYGHEKRRKVINRMFSISLNWVGRHKKTSGLKEGEKRMGWSCIAFQGVLINLRSMANEDPKPLIIL